MAEVDGGKQGSSPAAEVMCPGMKDVLKHWSVSTSERGSVEQALWARKRKVEQDVHRSRTIIEDMIRAHHNNLPENPGRLVETDWNADVDLLKFEQDIQRLRESMDRIDLKSIDEEDECQGRFVETWSENNGYQ